DIEQQHGDMQCGSPAVKSHTMLSATITRKILLKLNYIRAEAKRAIIQSTRNGCINLLAEATHLCRQIKVGNGIACRSLSCHRGTPSPNRAGLNNQESLIWRQRLSRSRLERELVKFAVNPARLDQIGVRTGLDNAATVHNDDEIGLLDSG